jgi:hypothetical protein
MRMRRDRDHGRAMGLAAGILAAWLVAMVATLLIPGRKRDRSGALLAVFPPTMADVAALCSVLRAHGTVVAAGPLPGSWHFHGGDPGFAGRLRDQRACLVLPPLPATLFGNAACFGMPALPPA